MADPQLSVPPRAPSPVLQPGVVHVRGRHTDRFTVVGNHLAQHRELTLTAIGLAVHIQSLPDGAKVDIRTMAARFPEGETRIAAALRELEACGYLSRTRERLPNGRIITHTVFHDRPGGSDAPPATVPRQARTSQPRPGAVRPVPAEAPGAPVPAEAPAPPPARPRAAPPLPAPRSPDPERHRVAAALLADLRRYDERLVLPGREVDRLATAVAAWLERGVSPDAVRRALTSDLPSSPRHPAGLLAHRLTTLLPPPLPAAPPPRTLAPPLQNCDGCDRAFRAPAPGHCQECRSAAGPERAA